MNEEIKSAVRNNLGVQAWSLRDDLQGDVEGSFQFLKKIGFDRVELYSLHGKTASQLKALLQQIGLEATAYHGSVEDWRDNSEALFADAKALGVKRLGIAWIKSDDGAPVEISHIRNTIALFRRHATTLVNAGITPYYHIHGYEFAPFDGGTLFDVLENGLKDLPVEYELDVFWVKHAGQDVVATMNRIAPQLTMLHLKDMRDGTLGDYSGETDYDNFVPVGKGTLDFPSILKAAVEIGVDAYWIEDESPAPRVGLPLSLGFLGVNKGGSL